MRSQPALVHRSPLPSFSISRIATSMRFGKSRKTVPTVIDDYYTSPSASYEAPSAVHQQQQPSAPMHQSAPPQVPAHPQASVASFSSPTSQSQDSPVGAAAMYYSQQQPQYVPPPSLPQQQQYPSQEHHQQQQYPPQQPQASPQQAYPPHSQQQQQQQPLPPLPNGYPSAYPPAQASPQSSYASPPALPSLASPAPSGLASQNGHYQPAYAPSVSSTSTTPTDPMVAAAAAPSSQLQEAAPTQTRRGKEFMPYRGKAGLVVAIDLGTTYSGASFCILTPGKKPSIEDCKSFPGQQTGASKVPSVVMYDAQGVPRLYGAEASDGASADALLDAGGAAARLWKLYLKPAHLQLIVDPNDAQSSQLEPLPFGLKAEVICAHFLAWMATCVGNYIATKHANGSQILAELANESTYIITIPNGWEAAQQQTLRTACVEAGLVSPDRSHTVRFVSEAEASVNFCASCPSSSDWLDEPNSNLIVCDAGGGTIDVSSYVVDAVFPVLRLSEVTASECLMAGSTSVDKRAGALLANRLRGTRFADPEDLRSYQQKFTTSIKEAFSSAAQDQYLAIGSAGDNDEALGIRRGKLVLSGADVAALYTPSIDTTEASIRRATSKANGRVVVMMVGGFAESVYFRQELQRRLGDLVQLCKPDEATAKAVANGAVSWHIAGIVARRVAKLCYGIRCATLWKGSENHLRRADQRFTGNDGLVRLPGTFGMILQKGQVGGSEEEHKQPFGLTWPVNEPLKKLVSLIVYRGDNEAPEFIDEEGFDELCRFEIDLEPFRTLLPPKQAANSAQAFVHAPVELSMKLSGTEISAQVHLKNPLNPAQTFHGPVSVFTDALAAK